MDVGPEHLGGGRRDDLELGSGHACFFRREGAQEALADALIDPDRMR